MLRYLASIRLLSILVVVAAVFIVLNLRREHWRTLGAAYRAQAARVRAGLQPSSTAPPLPVMKGDASRARPIAPGPLSFDGAAHWAFDESARYRYGIFTLLLAGTILVIAEVIRDSIRTRRRRTLMRLSAATKQAISGAKPDGSGKQESSIERAEL
jgi:hypothetical protein